MIEFSFFTYSDQQWDDIKVIIRDALGVDADTITQQITPPVILIRNGNFKLSMTGMEPLRNRIETVATMYLAQSAINRQSLRRVELIGLREDAESLRDRIVDALAIKFTTKYGFGAHAWLRDGVDDDMLTATSDYFAKLKRNLDRRIAQAGSRRGNARKTDRNSFWNQLLAIWRDLGGKERGVAAAHFLMVASLPMRAGAVPTFASVVQWLERRQKKTAKPVAKPMLRRATR
jgi:hypothetical protein